MVESTALRNVVSSCRALWGLLRYLVEEILLHPWFVPSGGTVGVQDGIPEASVCPACGLDHRPKRIQGRCVSCGEPFMYSPVRDVVVLGEDGFYRHDGCDWIDRVRGGG